MSDSTQCDDNAAQAAQANQAGMATQPSQPALSTQTEHAIDETASTVEPGDNRECAEPLAELMSEREAISRSTATIEFDPDGTIRTANDNFLAATGYRLDEIVGQHHRIFCSREYASSDDYTKLWKRLNQGEFLPVESIGCVRMVRIWIGDHNPVLDADGHVFQSHETGPGCHRHGRTGSCRQ